jgi:hypothetical protein
MSTKTNAKNAATTDAVTSPTMSDYEKQILAQLEGWEQVETGFPPYWKPAVGECIVARVCVLDSRDENFVRYVLQATKASITCARGPTDGAEEVIVQPGEFFTMGEYASLDLARFFDVEVFIKVTGTRKLPGNDASNGVPRKLFDFQVLCSPEDKKKLNAMRADEMKLFMARRTMGGRQIVPAETAQA